MTTRFGHSEPRQRRSPARTNTQLGASALPFPPLRNRQHGRGVFLCRVRSAAGEAGDEDKEARAKDRLEWDVLPAMGHDRHPATACSRSGGRRRWPARAAAYHVGGGESQVDLLRGGLGRKGTARGHAGGHASNAGHLAKGGERHDGVVVCGGVLVRMPPAHREGRLRPQASRCCTNGPTHA